jgi:hypothetical protein
MIIRRLTKRVTSASIRHLFRYATILAVLLAGLGVLEASSQNYADCWYFCGGSWTCCTNCMSELLSACFGNATQVEISKCAQYNATVDSACRSNCNNLPEEQQQGCLSACDQAQAAAYSEYQQERFNAEITCNEDYQSWVQWCWIT